MSPFRLSPVAVGELSPLSPCTELFELQHRPSPGLPLGNSSGELCGLSGVSVLILGWHWQTLGWGLCAWSSPCL